MPYSASALGVLPPLWSRAAKKPRPVLTFSDWVVFTLPHCVTSRARAPGGMAGVPQRIADLTMCRRAGPAMWHLVLVERNRMVTWDLVTRAEVLRAIQEYDRLGPEAFFAEHGFARTTTYELLWEERRYPPKAILGTAYELATGQRLASGDFEGGKSGAVKVLGNLGFTVQEIQRR